MRLFAFTLTGLAVLVVGLSAEETKEAAEPRLKIEKPAPQRGQSARRIGHDVNLPSLTNLESLTNFTVPPSGHMVFTGVLDYTGADQAHIAIECPPPNSLTNVALVVYWGNPQVSYLTATTVILGSNLLYKNMGGATVAAYGTALSIDIQNSGSTPVACDQMTVYAVVH